MHTSHVESPRIFVRVKDCRQFLQDIESPRGAFLKTRAPVQLGQAVIAVVKVNEVLDPIELPILVAGRRVRRDADKNLSPGIVARLTDNGHRAIELLRDVVSGRVVDLASRRWRGQRKPVTSVFATLQDLRRQLQSLMLGRAGFFVLDAPVHMGEALLLTCVVPASMLALTLTVRVRGVSHYENDFGVRAELLDPEYRARVDSFLRRTAWDARHA